MCEGMRVALQRAASDVQATNAAMNHAMAVGGEDGQVCEVARGRNVQHTAEGDMQVELQNSEAGYGVRCMDTNWATKSMQELAS